MRSTLFGLALDPLTMDQVVARCAGAVRTRQRLLVGVVNAAKIVKMRRDPRLRDSLLECDLLLADGQSVVWAAGLLGSPLPERVAGIDLFERLLDLADREARSVYLLGATPQVLALLCERLTARWPGLRIVGARDGYYPPAEAPDIAAEIRASGADMLFLGMSSPKKEVFLAEHGAALAVPVLHGVGGSFDVVAGITRRAPLRWQRCGMEWLYRLLQEPGRLGRRYLTTNCGFAWLTLCELARPTPPLAPTAPGIASTPRIVVPPQRESTGTEKTPGTVS